MSKPFFSMRALASILQDRNIEPDKEFTAAAGKDYGYVAAWILPAGEYLIAYGNNGETNYDVYYDADDLASWLESQDLDTFETIIQTANVRGNIEAAKKDEKGPFFIVKTRSYYGPTTESKFVETDDLIIVGPRRFARYGDAQKWIEDQNKETYTTSNNEIGAPTFVIVSN